jgi:hypothetical protein
MNSSVPSTCFGEAARGAMAWTLVMKAAPYCVHSRYWRFAPAGQELSWHACVMLARNNDGRVIHRISSNADFDISEELGRLRKSRGHKSEWSSSYHAVDRLYLLIHGSTLMCNELDAVLRIRYERMRRRGAFNLLRIP